MSYDLSKPEELVQFDLDCVHACNECPQQRYLRTIQDGDEVSIAGVFTQWFKNETLWSYGYNECLSEKAVKTFRRYAITRYGEVVDLLTLQRHISRQTYRIKCSWVKK